MEYLTTSWEAEPLPEPIQDVPDKTEILHPAAKVCPVCENEITREPGTRGRLPKYHPECKPEPTRRTSTAGSTRTSTRSVRATKAEEVALAQTEYVIGRLAGAFRKAVMLMALVDPYDAMVISIGAPEVLENLHPVLMRYGKLREAASGVTTGGSILGLAIAIITMVLPMAAHHKFIPHRRVAQFILNVPVIMFQMQKSMAENEGDPTEELMNRVMADAERTAQQRQRQQSMEEQNGGDVD